MSAGDGGKKRSRVKTNKKYFVINYFVHNILFNIHCNTGIITYPLVRAYLMWLEVV